MNGGELDRQSWRDAYAAGYNAGRQARHRDREWAQWLAGRIAQGKCALVAGWCVVHDTEDNPGHAYERGNLSTLD